MKAGQMLKGLWQNPTGRSGIILLGILGLTSIYVVLTFPRDFGIGYWANPSLWADNPKSAPPAWTNLLTGDKRVRHEVRLLTEPTGTSSTPRATELVFSMSFQFDADRPPTFLSFSLSDVAFQQRPPVISAVLIRPDGYEVGLHRLSISASRRTEEAPYRRHETEPLRIVIETDEAIVDSLVDVFEEGYGQSADRETIRENGEAALFGRPGAEAEYQPLAGTYRFEVRALTASAEDSIGAVKMVVGGSVFGFMGTDALGRNLVEGLLFGLPVALLIGIATSIVSTFIGMTLGMISGYSGGRLDILIQRAADIVANVPVLPLLIFLVFIGGSQLWLILLVLVAFSWPGLTIMVRSMVLQLRTGQEVEAARALGASGGRIIFRHIFPHVATYILTQLVFFAPSAILAEAGLSFLGLGDPTIPTWGQILEYGFRTGAVFLGYWWWVIPPGLMIVITAVTFMLLARGLEPVVDPRLRGRRSWHF